MKLVDANKLKQKIAEMQQVYNEPYEHYDNGFQDAVSQIDDVLDSLPTIDPVKHGKWLEIGQQYIQDWQMMNKCSACGKSVTNTRYGDSVIYFKFCPYCGAEMESETE